MDFYTIPRSALQAREQGYCGAPISTACLLGLVVEKGHFEVTTCTPKGY